MHVVIKPDRGDGNAAAFSDQQDAIRAQQRCLQPRKVVGPCDHPGTSGHIASAGVVSPNEQHFGIFDHRSSKNVPLVGAMDRFFGHAA
jgi:hypothetical protein